MQGLIDYIEDKGYFVRYTSDPLWVPPGCRELRIITYLYRGDPERERVFQYNWVFCGHKQLYTLEALKQQADYFMHFLEQTVIQYRLIDSTY